MENCYEDDELDENQLINNDSDQFCDKQIIEMVNFEN
jgi:hypothetical protein